MAGEADIPARSTHNSTDEFYLLNNDMAPGSHIHGSSTHSDSSVKEAVDTPGN